MITAFLASRRVRAFARHRLGLVGLVIVVTFTLVAVLAPWIAPHDPTTQRIATARLEPPSAQYLMGTDELGRDIFSRVVHGARISMRIGLIAEGIALLIGIVLGAAAGFFGGWVDNLIMRVADVFFAIPGLLFLIVIDSINALQIFAQPYILTQGGPGDSSRTVVMYIYEHGFRFFSMGYASTVALSLFVIILILTIVQFRLSRRWVFYQ